VYSPSVKAIKDCFTSGDMGDLLYIDSVRINLGLVQSDVNVIWDLVPHDLSIVDHLIGRCPRGVMATGASPQSTAGSSLAYVHVDYGDGLLASFHVNWLSPVKIRHMLIGGTRRSVLYNDLDGSEPVKVYDRGVELIADPGRRRQMLVSYRSGDVVSPRIEKSEPLQVMMQHFASAVRTGTSPITDASQGLRLVRTLEAADASIAKGGAYVEVYDD
jgi:predicted dehydrogenase